MEQAKKNLKITSIVVLILTVFSLVQIVLQLFFGEFNNVKLPEGAPENLLLIVKIVVLTISLIVLLPQVYIGIKGWRIANNPTHAKAHIVWAFILLVLSIIALISPTLEIVKFDDNLWSNVSTFCSILVEVTVFFEYIIYAKAVEKTL